MATEVAEELVVLLDADRRPAGTMPKARVHGPTRRCTWPSRCTCSTPAAASGHPPGAGQADLAGVWATPAATGRTRPPPAPPSPGARPPLQPHVVLPDFAYRAVAADGVVENEVCRCFAHLDGDPDPAPDPEEGPSGAGALGGVPAVATTAPWALSPWAVEQVRQLPA